MDRLNPDMSKLTSVKGMGKGRMGSLIRGLGGERELHDALDRGDVSLISSIDGISQKMAVDMVLAYRGENPGSVLGTDAVWQVYGNILELLRGYLRTETARNRASLLIPGGDILKKRAGSVEIESYRSLLIGRDRDRIESLLSTVSRKRTGRRIGKTYPYILLVEDDEAYASLGKKGLDRSCMVISPEDLTPGLEGEIIYVYNRRELDEERIPAISSVHHSSPPHELVPETALEGMLPLLEGIRAVGELRGIFGKPSVCSRAAEIIEEFSLHPPARLDPDEIRKKVEGVRKEVESSLEKSISGITLTGTDALSLLSGSGTARLKEIYREHARMATDMIRNRLGVKKDLFRMRYPLEVDEGALVSMIEGIIERASGERLRRKVALAGELISIEDAVRSELQWAVDLDWRFGLGCFVHDLSLHPFEISEGFFAVKGAADIHLRRGGQYQKIDFHLGPVPSELKEDFPDIEISDSRTALLTGANSGGKTTLLMTLAQILIMARMGLPVPADRVFLPDISRLFIYRPRRRLDAGGLETFLKELLPLSMKVDAHSLVLADELEAMTELEAASRIIGVFIEEISDRGAYSVIVTHMADEVLRFAECRVDGIEARGLDENYNIIVDRTPVIGLHASSTPELILKKLEATAGDGDRSIYSKVLERFR